MAMRWESDDVHRFRPMRGMVLTTAVFRTDVVKLGELELFQDTSYNPALHQPIVQRVVAAPKYLPYGRVTRWVEIDKGFDSSIQANRKEMMMARPPMPHSMPWRTTLEIKEGDTVYVDSFTLVTAENDNRCIEADGVRYYLVNYSDVYFKLTDGRPEMLNGWILVEPLRDPDSELVKSMADRGIVIPSIAIDNMNRREMGVGDKLGIVRHIGLPVDEYLDDIEEHDEIGVGDTVIFKWTANRRLESAAHRFFGDTELIVTRRPRIVGKVLDHPFTI